MNPDDLLGADLEAKLRKLSPEHAAYTLHRLDWLGKARPDQVPPPHDEQAAWLQAVNIGCRADAPRASTPDPGAPWTEFGAQAGRGWGKLICADTPVPTPNGWRRLGDLAVGDPVFDEAGAPCTIVKVFDGTPLKAYRLHFSDGTFIDACDEHQWVTWTHRDRKQYLRHNPGVGDFPVDWPAFRQPLYHSKSGLIGYCGPQIRTTQDIVDTFTHSSRGDTNHCVPTCGDLLYERKHQPLDPWVLGYWLGNGTARDSRISCHEEDCHIVTGLFTSAGFTCVPVRQAPERDFRANGLLPQIRALGVFDNKHVPRLYLEGAPWQRRRLLAGLLDSDGHCDPTNGCIEFCSTDKTLADGVVELARSLGQKPVLAEGRANLYGKDCGPKYRVKWRPTFQPFDLPRKARAWRDPGAQALRNRHRMIVRWEEIPPKPMRCLTVDGRNSMFLVGEGMIPTHNTRVGAEWLFHAAWEDPQALPKHVIAPTQQDVRMTCFEGESGLMSIIPHACIENWNRTELVLTLKNGAMIRGFSAEKADRLRGPQAAACWADELAAWGPDGEDVWDMMMFGMRLGPMPQIVWTSTPKPNALIRRLTAPKAGRVIVRGSTFDNRVNLPESFFAQIEAYDGTKLGRQELYGELLDPEESGIIRRSWLRLWPADKPLPAFQWIIMSLDTAFTEKTMDKKGDADPTACGVFGVFHHEKRTNVMLLDCWDAHLGLPELARRVRREMNNRYGDDEDDAMIKPIIGSAKPVGSGRKPDILLIEDKGSGISLRQTLAEGGIEAYAYNPGRADKLSRLHIVSPIFAQKRVWMPESNNMPGKPRNWCEPLIAQLCSFTGEGSTKHDDYVDVVTQAIRLCMDKQLLTTIRPPEERKGYEPPPPPDYSNPYAV
jgi:predicted phage terminase large subunit-like protein